MSEGRFAAPHVLDAWYVACQSEELKKAPLERSLYDTPIVLFRDGEKAAALLDRCAHRNVPLSAGQVVRGQIECPYHGWRFDGGGTCRLVPALSGPQESKSRRVPVYAVRECQGFVWIWGRADAAPTHEPYELPHLDDPDYITVRYDQRLSSTVLNVLENALDVPHTAFLHKGLFRGGKKNRITVKVRRNRGQVEAEYVGEPRPSGVIGRLLAPGGGTVQHFDRFLLPSIAQVEYGLGNNHLLITDLLTPVSDFETHMYAVATLKLVVGGAVAKRVLTPLAKRVVQQDADILRKLTENTRRFGGEQFMSTDVDVLGPHMLRLMRQAERGEAPLDEVKEDEKELLA